MSDKAWTGKTGGTRWMQLSLIGMFKYINPVAVYPIVWIWICFYIFFGKKERQGIWYYWHVRRGQNKWKASINLYLTFLEFGKVILDRFAAYAGRNIKVSIDNQPLLDTLCNQQEGFMLIGSHIGNQELAGYTFHLPKPMYALVYMGDTETVNHNRTKLFEQMGIHIIPVQQDGSHILDMHNALSNGNILSIHADRMFANTKAINAPLLGESAAFPEGPFHMAIAEKVPVVALFMMREKAATYKVFVRQLSDGTPTKGTKANQINNLLHQYIVAYEEMLERYPRQWFHFYPFWQHKN